MKITLLHPSRGRAQQANEALRYWLKRASGKHEIQHILSLDITDPQLELYKVIFSEADLYSNMGSFKIIINNNSCVVEATNRALLHSEGDILIYLSDDFKCPQYWDDLICKRIPEERVNTEWLLKVHDGLQKFHRDVLTIPIMSKELADRLGYFWYHEYRSMFVDQDLYYVCKNNDWLLYAKDLLFEHHHWCNKKAVKDTTYKRSEANWKQGEAIYRRRRLEGFPLLK